MRNPVDIIGDPTLRTFKEIDRAHGLPKGTAFRLFKRLEPGWVEGKHYWCCDSRAAPAAFAELRGRGRIYPATVNAVLLGDAACCAVA